MRNLMRFAGSRGNGVFWQTEELDLTLMLQSLDRIRDLGFRI